MMIDTKRMLYMIINTKDIVNWHYGKRTKECIYEHACCGALAYLEALVSRLWGIKLHEPNILQKF